MIKVLCFGTFDGLHPGHEQYFKQAQELGDYVIVIVALDETVRQIKGRLPDQSESERLKAVAVSPYVDEARLGYPGDKYQVLEEVQPQIILLGYDQEAFTDQLAAEIEKRGIDARIERAEAFKPEVYKSSLLRQQAKTE